MWAVHCYTFCFACGRDAGDLERSPSSPPLGERLGGREAGRELVLALGSSAEGNGVIEAGEESTWGAGAHSLPFCPRGLAMATRYRELPW